MDSRIEKARVLASLGRLVAAQEMLGEVLAGEPEDVVALADMANVVLRLRDYPRAVEYSAAALRGEPENTFAWRVRALAELGMARDVELGPEAVLEHRGRATAAAERAVKIDPENTDNLRILASTKRDKDPRGALKTLETALELDPDDVGVHLLRGFILRRNLKGANNTEQAELAFREALRLDPENAEALYELALIDLERGNRTAGQEQLRRVALLDPEYGPAVRDHLDWLAAEQDRLAQAAQAAETRRLANRYTAEPQPKFILEASGKSGSGRAYRWGIGVLVLIMIRMIAAGLSDDSSTPSYTPPPVPTWVRTPPATYYNPLPFPSLPPEFRRDWPTNLPRVTVRTEPPVAPPQPQLTVPPGVNPFP
ncbi:tetratricopeptide repeat protein [Nocardia sp. NBC_01503]|uniref:tetratricopeptide repeat protein n=1 Tax=Nocardia sp. NBC_01503 TaxID=2975997 RepID=UPI002E7C54D0|nr:tetratricopeptide repeat protein [Nocardia sp. NBC_01503]WTL34492.1 tetratricopeptide repeat protein [Nocardia sp. NBC_01503]